MRHTAQAIVCAVLLTACGGQSADTPTAPTSSSIFAPCPPREKATLSGNVHDPAGNPVPGAQVSLSIFVRTGGCGASGSATTDAAGNYQTRVDVTGGYFFQVTKPGFKAYSQSSFAVLGDAVRDVTLEPGVEVSGVVSESGVGPLGGATVEVLGGPNNGTKMQTRSEGIVGLYFLSLLPGDVTLRVSKTGYETIERTVHAPVSAREDFVLKWSYGTCLQSVTPLLLDPYPSAGGTETVIVSATAGRRWTAAPDRWQFTSQTDWIRTVGISSWSGDLSSGVYFVVASNPTGRARTGTIVVGETPWPVTQQ